MKKRLALCLSILSFTTLLGGTGSSYAVTTGTYSSVGGQAYYYENGVSTTSASGSVIHDGTFYNDTGSIYEYWGRSEAYVTTDFGTNRALASNSVTTNNTSLGNTGGIWSVAESFWADEFLITGGTGWGTASFQFALSGTLSVMNDHTNGSSAGGLVLNSDYSNAQATFIVEFDPDDWTTPGTQSLINEFYDVNSQNLGVVSQNINNSILGTFDFVYGQPFFITSYLNSYTYAGYAKGSTALADFGSTALLTSIVLPTGASISSASGTGYPLYSSPPPVPEPETYAMLLAGLGLLSFTARRKKQKA